MVDAAVAVLTELRTKAGMPGLRDIEGHSAGQVSKSSVHNLLKGQASPQPRTVSAFINACLEYARRRRWIAGLQEQERTEAYWLTRYLDAAGKRIAGLVDDQSKQEPNRSGLPCQTAQFVGRAEAVRELLALIDAHDTSRRAAAIYAIDGMAGVGKTELTLYVANELVDRCPDGTVFLDLAGYSPGLEPVTAVQALRLLLMQRGIPTDETQHNQATLRTLWRNECARRRLLLVLDNVRDKDQVEPLLPNAAGCIVFITSRRKLVGLLGVTPFALDVLTDDEAKELLLLLARVPSVDVAAVDRVVKLCGHLPLAIGIAASMLAHRNGYTIAALADDLAAERRYLDDLDENDGSLHAAVHASIRVSYHHLPVDLKKAFRLCGWHPGPEVTEPVLAAMHVERHDNDCVVRITSRDIASSRRLLLGLVDRNLIRMQIADGSRYRMHDLVRASARLTRTEASEDERWHALNHLNRAYRATLESVESWRVGGKPVPRIRPDDSPLRAIADLSSANAWVILERENLLALIDAMDRRSAFVSQLLGPKLRDLGFLSDARHCYEDAEKGYGEMGLEPLRAHAIRGLAGVASRVGDHASARQDYRRARSISRRINDNIGQAMALRGLGAIARWTDDYTAASGYLRRSIKLFAEHPQVAAGDPLVIREYATALAELGHVTKALGQLDSALALFGEATMLYVRVGDIESQYDLFPAFAEIERDSGNIESARSLLGEVLQYSHLVNDMEAEANALWELGQLEKEGGDPRIAINCSSES